MKVNLKVAISVYVCVFLGLTAFMVKNSIKSEEIVAMTYESGNEEIIPIVYDGMTLQELEDKLERSLNSTLKGHGHEIATKSIELGLDPYIAEAIILQETGCAWECSTLVKTNYNIGGMKSGKGYARFNSLDEGIDAYLNNLYYNYYSKGLYTPEQMNKKYAESKTWSVKVNKYIEKIKAA